MQEITIILEDEILQFVDSQGKDNRNTYKYPDKINCIFVIASETKQSQYFEIAMSCRTRSANAIARNDTNNFVHPLINAVLKEHRRCELKSPMISFPFTSKLFKFPLLPLFSALSALSAVFLIIPV